jgi:hypothetical protein
MTKAKITSSWGLRSEEISSGVYQFTGIGWTDPVAPNSSFDAGFCATGTGVVANPVLTV